MTLKQKPPCSAPERGHNRQGGVTTSGEFEEQLTVARYRFRAGARARQGCRVVAAVGQAGSLPQCPSQTRQRQSWSSKKPFWPHSFTRSARRTSPAFDAAIFVGACFEVSFALACFAEDCFDCAGFAGASFSDSVDGFVRATSAASKSASESSWVLPPFVSRDFCVCATATGFAAWWPPLGASCLPRDATVSCCLLFAAVAAAEAEADFAFFAGATASVVAEAGAPVSSAPFARARDRRLSSAAPDADATSGDDAAPDAFGALAESSATMVAACDAEAGAGLAAVV